MTCDLCGGGLLAVPVAHPCPCCLSTPATPELRELAEAWSGFNPWTRSHAAWYADPERRYPIHRVVPAYLGAGADLLARALAQRCGLQCGVTAPLFDPDDDGWLLQPSVCGQREDDFILFTRRSHCAGALVTKAMRLPTLATIPTDAPPDLRAARALVLCYEHLTLTQKETP